MHLLTVLVLLLSGLFQSLAVAQGVTCARTHAPVQAAEQPSGSDAADGPRAVSVEHAHDPAPQPDEPGVPAAPCGVAAIPSERSHSSPVTTARHLLPPGDLPPASLLIQSLFRPPRLS
jgi:hypothetical protein